MAQQQQQQQQQQLIPLPERQQSLVVTAATSKDAEAVLPVEEDPEVRVGTYMDQLKVMVGALKSRNQALSEENNRIKLELEAMRSDMGGRLFGQRSTFNDLIKSVEQLRETLAKKLDSKMVSDVVSGKPLRVVVAEVSSTPSSKLAEEMFGRPSSSDVGGSVGPRQQYPPLRLGGPLPTTPLIEAL